MKHIYKRLLGVLMALSLMVAMTAVAGPVGAIDLSRSCELTIKPGGSEYPDLQEYADNDEMRVDLYQIAKAAAISGYDAYTYEALDHYAIFQDQLSGLLTEEIWKDLAPQIAAVALNQDNPDQPFVEGGPVNIPIEEIEPGLYLVVVQGEVINAGPEGEEPSLATTFSTGPYTYTFNPSLVSLPSLSAGSDGSGRGEWIYADSITLKPDQNVGLGSLEIIGNLNNYDPARPATFVFQIEAVNDKEEMVYSDVASITFSQAGTQSYLLEDKIPIGATVTVTEIYSGVCYEVVDSDHGMATITAEDVAQVEFTNRSNGVLLNGGGITNSFTYVVVDEESGLCDWHWVQIEH